jgi:hypothetical protein
MEKKNNIIIEDVTIEEHINEHYDALTDVQRMILMNAPEKYNSTINLIGDCFKSGYHHGDSSLAGAISRLCRSFDNSYMLLEGDGFFGNTLAGASSPRYTKCRARAEVRDMIKKYSNINEFNTDGGCDRLNLDVPLGLCTFIVGIAIAYRSHILPRKLEDIVKYLDGDNTVKLIPHFIGFKGDIVKNKNNPKAWIISSKITYDSRTKNINIVGLPPMMRYDTFLKNLSNIMGEDDFSRMKVINNSKDVLDVNISTNGSKLVDNLITKLKEISSISFSEDIVFNDIDAIVEYKSIKDYLDDFKVYRNNSMLKKMVYDRSELMVEFLFSKLKKKFIEFLSKNQKNNIQVKEWISSAATMLESKIGNDDIERIKDRLKSIPAYKATIEEAEEAGIIATSLENDLKAKDIEIKRYKETTKLIITDSKAIGLVNTN